MGMFSNHASWLPQFGQRDRGRTIDRSFGHRKMHTFKNDPMVAPNANAYTLTNSVTRAPRGGGSRRRRRRSATPNVRPSGSRRAGRRMIAPTPIGPHLRSLRRSPGAPEDARSE